MRLDAKKIEVGAAGSVGGILQVPEHPIACYVMAHGAGAGMTHPFMTAVADGLCARHIATLRYQFPYMERGLKRTDTPAIAHAAVRAAVSEANRLVPNLPLFAGGKSFGGRMTSQAQAEAPLPYSKGLVFFKRTLNALVFRVGASLGAGLLAIPIEPVPGLDGIYDIAAPIILPYYWYTFFRRAFAASPTAPPPRLRR